MTSDKERIYRQLLVMRARRGEPGAIEELVGLWEPRLFYYIRRLVDQEADAWDVLQKTWIKVMRGIKGLRDPQSLPRWLYTLARNTALDHVRGVSRRRPAVDDCRRCEEALAEAEEGPAMEDAEAVHRALGKVSAAHREVLTLYFLEDLSVEEIGQVIGVPRGTVKSRLFYARRALREQIEKEGR